MGILCSVVFHGYELINFSIDPDEENLLGRATPIFSALLLRWGGYISGTLILPETIFPITALSMFLFAYGASFILIVSTLKIEDWRSVVVAAPFYFGFPVLLYVLVYNPLSYSVGLGILSATTVLWLSRSRTLVGFIGSTLLLAFAVSTYQSVLWFAIALFGADVLASTGGGENKLQSDWISKTLWYVMIVIIGLIEYFLIGFALLAYLGVEVVYIDSYLNIGTLFGDTLKVMGLSASELGSIYGGYAPIFLGQGFYYKLLAVALMSVTAWHLVRLGKRRWAAGIISFALVVVILIAPFLQHPTAGGFMPYRTLVGVPVAISVIVLFAMETAPKLLRRWLFLPLAVPLLIEFSAINNIQYYSGHWRAERDKMIASQIVLRLEDLAPNQTTYRIAVVGAGPVYNDPLVRPVQSSTLAYSIFEVTGGNHRRIANYLRFLSDVPFLPANQEQLEKAIEFAPQMPIWPVPGSVAQLHDIFVIKFGEPTQAQILTSCNGRHSDFCSQKR